MHACAAKNEGCSCLCLKSELFVPFKNIIIYRDIIKLYHAHFLMFQNIPSNTPNISLIPTNI